MNFTNRITLFGFGFLMGLLILVFLWRQKNAQFPYSPQARVKSSLLSKSKIEFQTDSTIFYSDSLVRHMVDEGTVVFSKSITNRDSCNLYHIDYENSQFLEIENCENHLVIKRIENHENF